MPEIKLAFSPVGNMQQFTSFFKEEQSETRNLEITRLKQIINEKDAEIDKLKRIIEESKALQ